MAKKVTPEMELKIATEKILGGSTSTYYNMNGTLLSRTAIDRVFIVIPEKLLLTELLNNMEIKIEELDFQHEYYTDIHNLFKYGDNLDSDDWIPLGDELYSGKVIRIKLQGFDHPIEITKELLPLKLRKAEYVDISYRIFKESFGTIVATRKDFKSVIPGYSFTTMTLFRVI